jgi:hypothetical protein
MSIKKIKKEKYFSYSKGEKNKNFKKIIQKFNLFYKLLKIHSHKCPPLPYHKNYIFLFPVKFPTFYDYGVRSKKSNSSSGINSVGAKHSKAPTHITYLLNRSLCASNSILFLFFELTRKVLCASGGDGEIMI